LPRPELQANLRELKVPASFPASIKLKAVRYNRPETDGAAYFLIFSRQGAKTQRRAALIKVHDTIEKFCYNMIWELRMELEYTYFEADEGGYIGYFTDFPQHVTEGETIEELEEMLLDMFECLNLTKYHKRKLAIA
jgi:hypothetical protein